jgi:hypothetical protein
VAPGSQRNALQVQLVKLVDGFDLATTTSRFLVQ